MNDNYGDNFVNEDSGVTAENLEQVAPNLVDLQQKIVSLQDELTESKNSYLRALAEADNARRRARIDVENAHKYGYEKIARDLLLVVDSLEKALTEANKLDSIVGSDFFHGLTLTEKVLLDTLEKYGVTAINPQNERFDPNKHEALSTQATSEYPPNTVLTVVQKGFMLHERVLRHARVIVAKELLQ